MVVQLKVRFVRGVRSRVEEAIPSDYGQKQVRRALIALNEEHPKLPREGDKKHIVPPVLRAWLRRVEGTGYSLVYTTHAKCVLIRGVVLTPD